MGNKEKMDDKSLLEYIKNKPCYCCMCANLKKEVLKSGLEAIDKHDGFICGGVEDIYRRRGRW